MDWTSASPRAGQRTDSAPRFVTVRGMFSPRPGSGSLRGEGEASAEAPFPLPGS